MPKTKQPAHKRVQRNIEKSFREGLLRGNGSSIETTSKGQKSIYHKKHGNLRVRFGDGSYAWDGSYNSSVKKKRK